MLPAIIGCGQDRVGMRLRHIAADAHCHQTVNDPQGVSQCGCVTLRSALRAARSETGCQSPRSDTPAGSYPRQTRQRANGLRSLVEERQAPLPGFADPLSAAGVTRSGQSLCREVVESRLDAFAQDVLDDADFPLSDDEGR